MPDTETGVEPKTVLESEATLIEPVTAEEIKEVESFIKEMDEVMEPEEPVKADDVDATIPEIKQPRDQGIYYIQFFCFILFVLKLITIIHRAERSFTLL